MNRIIFQKTGLQDLVLERARSYPISHTQDLNQERYVTENGLPKVVKYGSPVQVIGVEINGVGQDTYFGLKNWFEDPAIDWSVNNFTMVDEWGNSQTVRLWQDSFDVQEVAFNIYNIRLKLYKEQ